MELREIRQRLEKLCWRLLLEDVSEPNQTLESGNHAPAREQSTALEPRFTTPGKVDEQVAASPATMQRKTELAAGATAATKKHAGAGDMAREILGPNSGATINNVLVVGTDGSTPLKRMEIRFDDPEQVPAFFILLAVALKSSGFDLHEAADSGIPATEIWLTCSLDGSKKTSLSCAGLIGKQGDGIEMGYENQKSQSGNAATKTKPLKLRGKEYAEE